MNSSNIKNLNENFSQYACWFYFPKMFYKFVKYFLLTAMLTGVSNNAVFWQKMEYELKQWLEKMTAIAASSDHAHPSSGWRHITRATANADKDTNLTLFFIESIF